MEIDAEKARKLCSEAEFELFRESRDSQIVSFTLEGLKMRVSQARKLYELWSGRTSAEKDAGWGKIGEARKRAATGYITARQKAELFEDVLARFETRLAAVMKDPNLPVRDHVRQRKATGKINKDTGRVEKITAKVEKPAGKVNQDADSFARPAGEPLNKPDNKGDDPNRVWI